MSKPLLSLQCGFLVFVKILSVKIPIFFIQDKIISIFAQLIKNSNKLKTLKQNK